MFQTAIHTCFYTVHATRNWQINWGSPLSIYMFCLSSCLSSYEPETSYISSGRRANASPRHQLLLTDTGKTATWLWSFKRLQQHCHMSYHRNTGRHSSHIVIFIHSSQIQHLWLSHLDCWFLQAYGSHWILVINLMISHRQFTSSEVDKL